MPSLGIWALRGDSIQFKRTLIEIFYRTWLWLWHSCQSSHFRRRKSSVQNQTSASFYLLLANVTRFKLYLNVPVPDYFYLFFTIARKKSSNLSPQELEATALPTVPQPLFYFNKYFRHVQIPTFCLSIFVHLTIQSQLYVINGIGRCWIGIWTYGRCRGSTELWRRPSIFKHYLPQYLNACSSPCVRKEEI